MDSEIDRLRAELVALRETEAALRVAMREAVRLADAASAKLRPAPAPAPIFRAIAARPRPIGLLTLEVR